MMGWFDSKKMRELQDQVDYTLNTASSRLGQIHALFMASLVVVVCITFVIQTYPLDPIHAYRLYLLDQCITLVFFVDYILRWWARRFSISYLFTPFAIIDFISILPLFVTGQHWQIVRTLRLFRILRILRVLRSQVAFWNERLTPFHLRFAQILFSVFALVFISAGIMFDLERDVPGTQIHSFFEAIYFTVVTLTTVGFGDIVPLTTASRALTLAMILTGITVIPWQLGNLLRTMLDEKNKKHRICQTCGLERHEQDARHCKHCGHKLISKSTWVTSTGNKRLRTVSRAPEE